MATLEAGERRMLDRSDFPHLLANIQRAGFRIVGPTVRDGAIVYGEISAESDLPIGWTDTQEAGQYRLERRTDAALFGYTVGPHSWKKFLFPSRERLWTAHRTGDSFEVTQEPAPEVPYAFLGMRACELAAVKVSDTVFGKAHDPSYAARRAGALRIAVQCGQAGGTCFCVSMGTGPRARDAFDLALTELITPGRHAFLVEVGTPAGARVLDGLRLDLAGSQDTAGAEQLLDRTEASMGRRLDTRGIRELLLGNLQHPRWDDVARRCLTCANCTLACPTCFCNTTEEVPDLSGTNVERWRRWDSCFTLGFSELHAASVRTSTNARYRQWMTHKLATWFDQFGSSGCVGCGRCITWCPVGIDLTVEAAAIRAAPSPPAKEGA
jgi:ferredoxin